MSIYDYIVIAFYFAFMLALGPVFKSFSKTASDFFRGAGGMLWWMVGASSFMTTFSAWAFTGGAAKAYETGTFLLILFLSNCAAFIFTYFFLAAKFRQMRVITAVEGIRKRFGNVNEQVYAWIPVVSNLLYGGLGLYTVSVFIYGVFKNEVLFQHLTAFQAMGMIIIMMGVTVTVMTLLGGSWAATAGDFVQMLVVMSITLLLAVVTLIQPEIGGLSGLIEALPEHHFDWTLFERKWIIVFFAVSLLVNQGMQNNSMLYGASKYVFAKDGIDAKKATLVSVFGYLIVPPIWIIPALAATIYFPDLAASFPELGESRGNSAAYVAMAIKFLPNGLLGLLISGIFAASITTMNSMLNISSGTFVRNFYIRFIDTEASESKQILVGRIFIVIYSAVMIGMAFLFLLNKEMSLFDLLLMITACIGIPKTVPMFLGLFVRKVPSWAGWSTVVVGLVAALVIQGIYAMNSTGQLFNNLLRPVVPFSDLESGDLKIAVTTVVLFIVTIGWFYFTKLFYSDSNLPYKMQVNKFFEEINRPVDRMAEHGDDRESDVRQYDTMGKLCLVYGLFVILLLLIPNTWNARFGILFCGGTILLAGLILKGYAYRGRKRIKESLE